MKVIFFFIACMIAAGVSAKEALEQGPGPLLVNFMTQFYDVQASEVEVTIIEQTATAAKVLAWVGSHQCVMEAVPATTPQAKYGWSSGSMSCEG
ncbi:hypothetical protein [Pseudomonas syringae]|uniref:hypothetical protein n=1 Tax=Pseudomonas syringae TaxID=317 RepID=UPI0024630C9C|nr:hypothetical protein [Pseudomonas syringae]MDH4602435.1 hypothetical protein [Pseudomonas syringae pv. papulans]